MKKRYYSLALFAILALAPLTAQSAPPRNPYQDYQRMLKTTAAAAALGLGAYRFYQWYTQPPVQIQPAIAPQQPVAIPAPFSTPPQRGPTTTSQQPVSKGYIGIPGLDEDIDIKQQQDEFKKYERQQPVAIPPLASTTTPPRHKFPGKQSAEILHQQSVVAIPKGYTPKVIKQQRAGIPPPARTAPPPRPHKFSGKQSAIAPQQQPSTSTTPPITQAPSRAPVSYKYVTTKKERNIGWLTDTQTGQSVLVNIGRNTDISTISSCNAIRFVSPSAPGTPLPKGLFFWKTDAQPNFVNTISQLLPVPVRAKPNTRKFTFQRDVYKDYKNPWDPKRKTSYTFPTLNIRSWCLRGVSQKLAPATTVPARKIVRYTPPASQIFRIKFFDDIVGYPENNFRAKLGWNLNNKALNNWHDSQKSGWIKAYPRRAAIFQGKLEVKTVGALKSATQNIQSLGKPKLRIRVQDPKYLQGADIRFIQANPTNKDAVFQVASTLWGPLEGGMIMPDATLDGMLYAPVQGEEASIATAGATIWRKYFMPTYNVQFRKSPYYYLLENTGKFNKIVWRQRGPYIDWDALTEYRHNANDINNVSIGFHSDIVVTSGYGHGKDKLDQQTRLPIYLNTDGSIDLKRTQIITQVFVAAMNLKGLREKYKLTPQAIQAAQLVLTADYLGTVLTAAYLKKPKVFFTMVGAGSFQNEVNWLYLAIKKTTDDIQKYGLNVTILYRPDKPRGQTAPKRDAITDATFIKNLVTTKDYIEGTTGLLEQTQNLIDEYAKAIYQHTAKPRDQTFKNNASRLAQQLNALLDN